MTDLYLYLISGLASFIYVALRAFQQLNVVQGNYWRVMPCSLMMGIGDVVLITLIVKTDSLWIGVVNGLAAGVGCMLAMYLNKRWRKVLA